MNIRFVTGIVLATSVFFMMLAAFPDPASADGPADLQAGREAMQSGELDKALRLLSSAAEQMPDSVPALTALADCHLKMGSLVAAGDTFRRVLKISPNHRLAARVLRALTGQDRSVQQQLQASADLMEVRAYAAARSVLQQLQSRPLPESQPLSVADQVQAQLLMRLAELARDDSQRQQIAPLLLAQIQRYRSADDFRGGLTLWATWNLPNRQWALRGGFEKWPATPARHKLELGIAQLCQAEGQVIFEKHVSSQVKDANVALNEFDRLAMLLVGRMARFPQSTPLTKSLKTIRDSIVYRYGNAERWQAAVEAVQLAHAGQEDRVLRLAVASLRQSQVQQIESRQLADGRRLPDQLHPLLLESLQKVAGIFRAGPSTTNRGAVASFADVLVQRYEAFGRYDLATAVLVAVETGEPPILVDWSLWMRAELIGRQVEREIAVMGRVKPVRALPLQAGHQQQLKLLDSLIQQHPGSVYVPSAVERLFAIAARYRQLQSPATAGQVLQSILATHPNHAFTPRAELEILRIGLSEAHREFQKRADERQAPRQLLEAHAKSLTELLEFLARHQADSHGQAALAEVWKLMEIYGRAESWPAVRDIIGRVAKRLPELRTAAQYQFLLAATWVGELDSKQGLLLILPPAPQSPGTRGGSNKTGDKGKLAAGPTRDGKKLPGGFDMASGRAGGGFAGGGFGKSSADPFADSPQPAAPVGGLMPSATALTGIRQAQRNQVSQIAMLESRVQGQQQARQQLEKSLALPSGKLLTEAEIKRQDEAADQVYGKIATLLKAELQQPEDPTLRDKLRLQFDWLVGYFEARQRPQRAYRVD